MTVETIDLTGQVAIVTGAGAGLGRSHALLLAERGAKVVVNDLGDGAAAVVDEILMAGGTARAALGSITDRTFVERMVAETVAEWGRIDILINNAGILRDKSFAKMDMDDFDLVVQVHLLGAAYCSKAVWETMRQQEYGRIIMTTSSSGLYGNFGQSNYGAAKMGLVGLMQTLALEGERYGINVNCIAPTAATQMMEGILPEEQLQLLAPERVSPVVLALASKAAPTRAIMCAGAGGVEMANITLTQGIYLSDEQLSAEEVLEQLPKIAAREEELVPGFGFLQSRVELKKAGYEIKDDN